MPAQRFSSTFARQPARAPRGLTPGRRVWATLGGTAAAVVVLAGATAAAGRLIDLDDEQPAAAALTPPPEPTQPAPEPASPAEESEPAEEEPSEEPEPSEDEPEQRAPRQPAEEVPAEPAEEPAAEQPAEPEQPAEDPAGEQDQRDPPAAPQRVSGPTGQIIGLAGKCAATYGPNPAPGAELQLTDCAADRPGQQWTVASDGTLRVWGLCLSPAGGATGDGTRVVLVECDASQQIQHWRIERAAGDIVNVVADKCLDVANANTTNGTPLQIAWCSGNSAQKWSAP